MKLKEISSEIGMAECLDPRFYVSGEAFEASKARIFRPSWQFAGVEQRSLRHKPVTILEDFLDARLILCSTDSTAFSNVCTHRGKILLSESNDNETIRCGYHGRTFDCEGRFRAMPGFEGVAGFPDERDSLARFSRADAGLLAFVRLASGGEFEEYFGSIDPRLWDFVFGSGFKFDEKVYQLDANWALYCENYLEGFHIPFVHKALAAELDLASYKTELFRYSSLQNAAPRNSGEPSILGYSALYYFVFPNLMLNFYPWGLSMNVVEPVDFNRTRVRYLTFVVNRELEGAGAGGDLETVELEDQAVVESVQKGIESGQYERGRYSPEHETGTHHFHRLIVEFMNRRTES